MSKYRSPVDCFRDHADSCPTSKENPFGLCAHGFRLLGEISRLRDESRQLEIDAIVRPLRERPLVRARLADLTAHR